MPQQEQKLVSPEALIIAREKAMMTQSALSRASGISQAKISRFEDGLFQPTSHEVEALGEALGVPTRFFFRTDIKRSVFNSFYRKRKSVSIKALMQFNAKICVRQAQLDRLLSKTEILGETIPRYNPEDFQGGIKEIAELLRQFLRMPPGPITDLISPIEDAGIIIVFENFGLPTLDGVSTMSRGGKPIIFINSQMPPSRRRFTCAHELSHAVLHRGLSPDVEEQANRLAAEFLMPEDEIIFDLKDKPITLGRLADLKLKWKVAMAALLFRSKTLDVIDQRRYYYLWKQISQAGYRIREPHEEYVQDSFPSLEREIMEYHANNLHYTCKEFEETLDESTETILNRMQNRDEPPTFRIV